MLYDQIMEFILCYEHVLAVCGKSNPAQSPWMPVSTRMWDRFVYQLGPRILDDYNLETTSQEYNFGECA